MKRKVLIARFIMDCALVATFRASTRYDEMTLDILPNPVDIGEDSGYVILEFPNPSSSANGVAVDMQSNYLNVCRPYLLTFYDNEVTEFSAKDLIGSSTILVRLYKYV